MVRKLLWMLREPEAFFEATRNEGWRPAFTFLLQVSAAIAVFTPLVNALGWESTDTNSTYQAQVLAWQVTRDYLLPRLGIAAYLVEALLILGLAVALALFLTAFLHVIFRALGGQGPVLNAWKAACL